MLKRTWAIVLSLVMLVTLCPSVSVFAEDAAAKPTAIVEDFEDGVVDSSIVKLNDYAFTQNVSNGVLSITNIVNGSCLGFNHTYNAAKEAVYLSYDIQFKTLPTTVAESTAMIVAGAAADGAMGTMRIKGTTVDGETKLRFTDQSGNALSNTAIEAEKWYKIIYAKNLTDASSSNIAIAAVLDEDGNLIGFNRRTGMGGTHTQYSIIRAASSFTGAEILIDNVKFSAYDRKTYGPSVMDYFVATDADGYVKRTAKSMVVSFEEALKTTPTATITSGSNTIDCSVAQLSSATTTMLYKITWTDDLAAETNYTLSISGSNEASNTIVGTVEFSTAPLTLADSVIRDDFETASEFSSDNLYNKDYATDTDTPFASGYTTHGAYPVTGYNGGTAISVQYNQSNTTGSRATLWSSQPHIFGDNNAVVVTYKMKISNATIGGTVGAYTGGNNIWIGTHTANNTTPQSSQLLAVIDLDKYTGEHYIGLGNCSSNEELAGEQGYYYTEDTWYNVTYAVGKNSASFVLSDITTGEVLWKNTSGATRSNEAGYYIGLAALTARDVEGTVKENGEGAAVIIDDVSLWSIDSSKAAHNLVAGTPIVNDDTVTITFNQPTIIDASMIYVSTDSEGNDDVDKSIYTVDVKYTDFDTNKTEITLSGLAYEESYYLDYSGVKSAGGAAIAAGEQATLLVQFTMPTPVRSDMDSAKYESDKVTLNFWAMNSESNAAFIAAFYKGTTLVDVALLANQALSAKKNEVSFTAANVPADADGMIVYALNSLGSLVPLCAPTAKVAIN